jgi:hypothetical protein
MLDSRVARDLRPTQRQWVTQTSYWAARHPTGYVAPQTCSLFGGDEHGSPLNPGTHTQTSPPGRKSVDRFLRTTHANEILR